MTKSKRKLPEKFEAEPEKQIPGPAQEYVPVGDRFRDGVRMALAFCEAHFWKHQGSPGLGAYAITARSIAEAAYLPVPEWVVAYEALVTAQGLAMADHLDDLREQVKMPTS